MLNEIGLGEMPLPDGGKVNYHSKTKGQRVSVRFEDGRVRTIITPQMPLKLLDNSVEQ